MGAIHALLERVKIIEKQPSEVLELRKRGRDASLRYTGIQSHTGLAHYGLYDTVVARD